jgi:phosphoribosylglycinamide formyltransferase-1
MLRLGILGSTRGTVLVPIIEAIHKQSLAASIEMIVSNKQDAGILEKAKTFKLPHQFVDPNNVVKDNYDKILSDIFVGKAVDLIILIGYMRILSDAFVTTWRNKIINVHPSLLPKFAGGMDKNVHQAVLDAGEAESGCTVHVVTEEVDSGPILVQKKCVIEAGDTVLSLKDKVQLLEGQALIEAIKQFNKN